MNDAKKLQMIAQILADKPMNYGGYIENALDIANDTLGQIENIINDIEIQE